MSRIIFQKPPLKGEVPPQGAEGFRVCRTPQNLKYKNGL